MQGWWFMNFPITTDRFGFGFLFRPLNCHPGMLHLHLSNHYEYMPYFLEILGKCMVCGSQAFLGYKIDMVFTSGCMYLLYRVPFYHIVQSSM